MRESYGDLVARLFLKVKAHMEWTEEKTNLWFRTNNPNLGWVSPDDFIARRPDKAEKWINDLIEGNHP